MRKLPCSSSPSISASRRKPGLKRLEINRFPEKKVRSMAGLEGTLELDSGFSTQPFEPAAPRSSAGFPDEGGCRAVFAPPIEPCEPHEGVESTSYSQIDLTSDHLPHARNLRRPLAVPSPLSGCGALRTSQRDVPGRRLRTYESLSRYASHQGAYAASLRRHRHAMSHGG